MQAALPGQERFPAGQSVSYGRKNGQRKKECRDSDIERLKLTLHKFYILHTMSCCFLFYAAITIMLSGAGRDFIPRILTRLLHTEERDDDIKGYSADIQLCRRTGHVPVWHGCDGARAAAGSRK